MKPIYEPKGKAKEYGDLAINIYTGCPHRCFYCFAPGLLHRDKEEFHTHIEPRPGIVQAVKEQIEREHISDKLIHLCFTCDPYPVGYDTTATREIIKIIKESGNHVQILTKGDGMRDFDLLDENDWYGITEDADRYSGDDAKSHALRSMKLDSLVLAYSCGIKTWISFEPVLDEEITFRMMRAYAPFTDKYKIGKLNYYGSDIDWGSFGKKAEALCKELGVEYYIKESLREEMEKTQ